MPTFGQLLLLGVGLEARAGLATRDMVDDVFSPPEVEPGPPCVHTPPPVPEPLRPRHLRRHRARGGNLDVEWGVREGGREGGFDGRGRGGDVGTWGYTAPHAPGPRLAAAPRCRRAKESKKGTWTVTCPCECEVCMVFYPVFTRSSRELRDTVLRIRKCFRFGQACKFTNFARFRMDSYRYSYSRVIDSLSLLVVPSACL